MWGFKKKKAEVLSHWYQPVAGFSTSTQEFYAAIERILKEMQVPGLDISRVDFAEGGLLSAKREYLRMSRERLVFDVCAAPFGTSYFFSLRFAELPAAAQWWEILIVVFFIFVGVPILWQIFGFFLGSVFLLLGLVATIYLLRNLVALGLQDLDASLIKTPVLGPIYESFFRKETYYRQDTRLMYLTTVNAIVEQLVRETTSAKGLQLLPMRRHSPLLDELYRPVVWPELPSGDSDSSRWAGSTNT